MMIGYTDYETGAAVLWETDFFIHNPPNWGAVIMISRGSQDNMPVSIVVVHSIVKSAATFCCGQLVSVGKPRLNLTAFGDN